jgi:hypothetical protein
MSPTQMSQVPLVHPLLLLVNNCENQTIMMRPWLTSKMSCKYLSLVISIYGSILPCKECSYFLCPLYILFLFLDGTHPVGNVRTLDFPSLFLFIDGTHHVGNVRTLDFPSLFLFIGVEHGTASRWCELLGTVGTQLLLFCFKPLLKQGIIYTVNYIKSI